jgi:hypothetical protein
VRYSDTLKTTELYFNVARIVNKSTKPVTGEVNFNGPENWKIFSFPSPKITINPGDTAWVPVRVSPYSDAIGGITYIINATFKTDESVLSENAYVTLPSKTKWDFSVSSSSIFFTEYSPNVSFKVSISNKGNTNQLVKLHLQVGKLLYLLKSNDPNYVEYIDVPAFKDTIITFGVSYQKNLSYQEKTRYENNWKESAILIYASSAGVEKSTTVMIKKLNSTYQNNRDQNSSPLNLDYQVNNLMSNQKARYNIRTYGSVLFSEKRDLSYSLGLNNLYFDNTGNKSFDINNQFLYTIRYNDMKNTIVAGYNINGGELHPINGRGIEGTYKINDKNKISYAFSQNPYGNGLGEYIGYSSRFKNVVVTSGITNENAQSGKYKATSVSLGAGFVFLKYHFLTLQTLFSRAAYNLSPGRDTSLFGMSYRIMYNVQYKKLELRSTFMNSKLNYIHNSGSSQMYIDGKYSLNDKIKFILYGNRQFYSNTNFPYNFFNPSNHNSNDYIRLTASLSKGIITYQLGPNYIGSLRQYYNPLTKIRSEYMTFQPGIWGASTIRLSGDRSITPNITLSSLKFNFNSDDPLSQSFSWKKNLYYAAGINYFDNVWRINAYYSSGTTSDLYRNVLVDEKPVLSRSIQVRPSFEKYLFDRKVRVSAYLNYSYFMPSGRETVSYNGRYDQFFKSGWTFYISGYVYSNTRVDEKMGRINSKDLNFIVGVTKSFDIQQPRLKYYDLKTVFFNDLDGNLTKSPNEPPVANILVNIEKDRTKSDLQSYIPSTDMISDVNGEIFYENLPQDIYKLKFTPLVNLQSLYFLNGAEQGYFCDQDRTLYIPLAESYKIKGRIILVRDPNSSEGKISVDGVRLTATGPKGETYSALTDNFGSYILNVPKAEKFNVKINNVFGAQFSIANDELVVQFTGNKTINLDFTFVEKKREINFNNGNEFFKFKTIEQDTTK